MFWGAKYASFVTQQKHVIARKMSRYYSVLYTKKAPNKVAASAHFLCLWRTERHADCKELMIVLLNNVQKRKNKTFADGLLAVDGTCCRLYDEVVTRRTPTMLAPIWPRDTQ